MKPLLSSLPLLFAFSLSAQAPVAVPAAKEPHHHLVLENSYVRVLRVSIPAHDATLLHQHDVPYIYVALGPGDVINAVAGKPEAHLVMTDGQVGYSRGGFAHIARTDAGLVFNNVTIELLKPQGKPKNVCAQILLDAPEGDCPKSRASHGGLHEEPLLDTGRTTVDLVRLDPSLSAVSIRPQFGLLIVFLGETQFQGKSINAPTEKVAKGDVIWVSPESNETIWNSRTKNLSYLALSFSGRESLESSPAEFQRQRGQPQSYERLSRALSLFGVDAN